MKRQAFLVCGLPILLGALCLGPACGPTDSPTDGNGINDDTASRSKNRLLKIGLTRTVGGIDREDTLLIELFEVQAPDTAARFLQYVQAHRFDGTILHYAGSDEGVRAGKYTSALTPIEQFDSPANESNNGLANARRYIATVGTEAPTSEFVIYTAPAGQLTKHNYKSGKPPVLGRTVFGRVVSGLSAIDDIVAGGKQTLEGSDGTLLPQAPDPTVTVSYVRRVGEPYIVCPDDVTAKTTGDRTPVDLGVARADDDEDGDLTPTNDAPAEGFPLGTTTVTWSATDSDGHIDSCEQTVIIRTDTRPELACPADVSITTTTDLTDVDLGEASATDVEDGELTATNDAPADGFPIGETLVTWSVTDSDGNTTTCTQTVLVKRDEPPVITCPADVSAPATGVKTIVDLGEATVTDPEDGDLTATNDAPADGFPHGETTVTWTATDSKGNTVTCTQKVTIDPGEPPVITCPADVSVPATGVKTIVDLGTPTATDPEDGDLTATNDAPADGFPHGETIVTWTATDSQGNTVTCTQTVTIDPGEPPVITCPADVSVPATGVKTIVDLGTPTATDPEDGDLTATNDAPADGFPHGETIVTWTATDSQGNSRTCTQKVTIDNGQTPQITCPANITTTATGVKTIVDLGTATATDPEDGVLTATNDAPADGFPVGETTVTWSATDSQGNTVTCTQTVTITQGQLPQITCPPEVTVEATGPKTDVTLGTATATDPEDGTLTPTNDAPADGFPLGETIVTWRAVDTVGNEVTCRQRVTVINPIVQIQTTLGDMVIELYPAKAPITVANFLTYVNENFYNGLIFHRVAVNPAVIQGGGYRPDMTMPATHDPIVNEANNGLLNNRGTIAMARTSDPNSATSQFYINVQNNNFLDYPGSDGFGYCVFGRVIKGLETVDAIAATPVVGEKPVTDVVINSARHIADIVTTASGLKYQDIVVGTGDVPVEGSDIDVTYSGSLVDATTDFDSGTNVTFSLYNLVPGFSEGVGSMRVGGIRRLILPPELGYGESGSPPTIPPNATLTFLVELRNFWP